MNHYFAIEGNDCAGKNTLTKGLLTYIERYNLFPEYKIKTVSFPAYESKTGKMITKFLNGKILKDKPNDLGGVVRKAIAIGTLYADNRIEWYKENFDKNEDNVIYIFDRYMLSNLTHQLVPIVRYLSNIEAVTGQPTTANLLNAIAQFNNKVCLYETVTNKLPKAHHIIIDVSAETSLERMKKRNGGKHSGKDILESEAYVRDVEYVIRNYIATYMSENAPELSHVLYKEDPGIVLPNDESGYFVECAKASPATIAAYMNGVIRKEKEGVK